MKAADRAKFINAANAGGNAAAEKICPGCGAVVKARFCSKCGMPYPDTVPQAEINQVQNAEMPVQTDGRQQMPFVQAEGCQQSRQAPFAEAENYRQNQKKEQMPFKIHERRPSLKKESRNGIFGRITEAEESEKSVFAEGLPEWTPEPLQMAVRRKGAKKL